MRIDRWFRRYALLPLTILAAGSLLWTHRAEVDNALMAVARHLPDLPSNDPAPTLAPGLPGSVDPSIVHLNARPGLDTPVRVVTRWTISDPRFGRIEVFVPVGKTPREALTVALAERGYQVVR